jgi:hypothetical protein
MVRQRSYLKHGWSLVNCTRNADTRSLGKFIELFANADARSLGKGRRRSRKVRT